LSKESTISEDASDVATLDAHETPVQNPARKRKSNSSSKKKKKQESPQPAVEENPPQTTETPPDILLPDAFMDSSEEVDTQIASQLEQDLEFAVDMDDKPQSNRSNSSSQQPAARKRKRAEEEPRASKRNDRRRSTRLTIEKDADGAAEKLDDCRSQGSTVTEQTEPVSSPTATRRSARHSQRKAEDTAPAETVVSTQESVVEEPTEDAETPRPTKRSRKSLRLNEQAPSPAVESVVPTDAILTKRTRKTRSQRNVSQPASVSSEVSGLGQIDNGDQDVVHESIVTEGEAVEHSAPLSSTGGPTDTLISETDQSTEPATTIDTKMEMDDVTLDQQTEQTISLATSGTQTEDLPTEPRTHINEANITQSLKTLLGDMKLATLDPSTIREVDDLLFHLRVESLRALDRHNNSA
jgi:hypothetical protein